MLASQARHQALQRVGKSRRKKENLTVRQAVARIRRMEKGGKIENFKRIREQAIATVSTELTCRRVKVKYERFRRGDFKQRLPSQLPALLLRQKKLLSRLGYHINYSLHPLVVVVVSPLMSRLQKSVYMSEAVFFGSSTSLDVNKWTVTFILVPTPAGGIPIGLLFTRKESSEVYEEAFKLLREISPPLFSRGPTEVTTEYNAPLQNSLRAMWPKATFRLCMFAVSQAVRRWLALPSNKVPPEHRKEMFHLFRLLQESRTVSDANATYRRITKFPSLRRRFPNFLEHLEQLWNSRKEWALAYRSPRNRGHNTINCCKTMMRMLKARTINGYRCYNLNDMLYTISHGLERYLEIRMLAIANDPWSSPCHKPHQKKMKYLKSKDQIEQVEEAKFRVPADDKPDAACYLVNARLGKCECAEGFQGKVCVHQYAVYRFFGLHARGQIIESAEERHAFAVLAVGDNAPPLEFYQPQPLASHRKR